ncbi:MAG TPA: hypothetical protein VGS03_07250 [Candidatus Polarisedimenticolia bacterium]|jgi:hypothetical protein|nr:hypothetical protein [Candidatus Polarisedimenticolia bacterium]
MRPARFPPIVLALAVWTAALAPTAAAPDAPVIAPFLCPESGPNGGHAPLAMAKSAGHLLVLCADTESEEGTGLVASAVAIHEPESPTPKKPVFSTVSDSLHVRVQAVPDRGFELTWESLLPREGGGEYGWSPITRSNVACGPEGCAERDARCAVDVPESRRQDLFGRVRQLTRTGTLEPSVAQRLIDDLTVQALLGDDVAAWSVEHLDHILAIGQENRDGLAQARGLLDRARAAQCAGMVFPPDEPPPPPPDPAAQAAELKEKIARSKGRTSPLPATAPDAPPAGLDAIAWLVGGRWEGSGALPEGGTLHVEETYRWGPERHSIRFRARNAAASAKDASAVDGIVFFEAKPGKIVLWNLKPGGGFSESTVTRADRSGCEFVGADGRVRLSRVAGDQQKRVVDQLRGGAWTTVVTASYERRPR